MGKSVAILMTTYNGERYLSQQIDSIRSQTFTNWTLFIRDDGSKDKTVEVIQRYSKIDDRIRLVENPSKFHGAYYNFFNLIEYVKNNYQFDYYFFCDQDDIWKEHKLEIQLLRFSKDEMPEMVYSDMSTIDANNKLIDISINNIMGIELPNINNLYFINAYIWGCTAGFNHALLEMVPSVDIDKDYLYIEKLSHDNYFAKFALEYGKVLFCPEQLVLYRRHGHNVTTSHHFKLSPLNILRKAILGFNELALTHAGVYNQTLYMLKKASEKSPLSDRLLEIQEVIKIGGLKGVRYFCQNRISRKQLVRTIGLYTIMLFGTYKKYIMKELS